MDPGSKSCGYRYLVDADGKHWERDTKYFGAGARCHDCGIENKIGNVHHWGCDMERCPKCRQQLIGCDCWGDTVKLCKSAPVVVG